MLSFVRYWSDCLLKELYHFAPPPAVNRSSCCTTSSPVFVVVSVWDFGPSHRCVVVSCFNLKFPSDVFTFYIGSVIHFEFMFVKGVRFVSIFLFFFFFLTYGCPVVGSTIFLKKLSLLHYITFTPLSEVIRLYVGLFLASVFVQLIHLSVLSPVPQCLDYCCCIVTLEVG